MENAEIYNEKDKLIQRLTELAESGKYVFRGYNQQDQLLPNIVRNDCVKLEKELLFEFERHASQYLNTENPVDFMSIAQHYGLSTRLLDFTYNPFVALFFALFKSKSPNCAVEEDNESYYIRYCEVEENILIRHVPIINHADGFKINSMAERSVELIETVDMLFNERHPYAEERFLNQNLSISSFFQTLALRTLPISPSRSVEINREKIRNKKLFFIDPNQSNQRIVMQQGLFMFPYILDPKRHMELLDRNTQVLKIHKSIREDLQKYLETIGINTFRLMPDLASVCSAVERKVREPRNSISSLSK